MKESEMFRIDKLMKKAQKKYDKKELDKKEFEEMCKKAGVKKESLCKTVFTKNL